ncbi:uncharacterized protein LOC131023542 [Salvia miltiorrhiza]|uniref:uncharacterized protein LOC131023521 n=1 Tax=Salvia miltiorrhiza TaxID=226208 RepID=UPI0025AD62F3|nr:uncharacterized protein LOC131023521 [Salvia miltiorrhiza]XP_057809070.1 uncharacterized protein LOC131023542 [Salvia miltiorrhiza]
MEITPLNGSVVSRRWRKRGYSRLSPTNRRSLKVVRLNSSKRSWRLRLAPKLRLMRLASPLKLWYKFKNAYMSMMLKFAHTTGTSDAALGAKRIPKARQPAMAYSRTEFENRLVLEIYKSMVASLELGYHK